MSASPLKIPSSLPRRDRLTDAWQVITSNRWAAFLLALLALTAAISASWPRSLHPVAEANLAATPTLGPLSVRSAWLTLARHVDEFEAYRNVWLRVLFALKAFTLLIRLADRVDIIFDLRQNLDRIRSLFLMPSPARGGEIGAEVTVDTIRGQLRRRRGGELWRVWQEQSDSHRVIYVERVRFALWGDLLFHLGGIVIIAALFASAQWGWAERGVALANGESYELTDVAQHTLTLDGLSPCRLSMKFPDGHIRQATLGMGQPLWGSSFSVFLARTGPALWVKVTDRKGQALLLQPTSGKNPPTTSVALKFSDALTESDLSVPALGISIRVDRYPSLPDEGYWLPVYLVRAYLGDRSMPLFTRHIWKPSLYEWQDYRFSMEPGEYALLNIASDPGWYLLPVGGLFLLVGSLLTRWPRPFLAQIEWAGGRSAPIMIWHGKGRSADGTERLLSLLEGKGR